MIHQTQLDITTRGRGTYAITDRVDEVVRASGVVDGLCHVFLQHTSASLILCENADPDVRGDLERFLARLVVDGDPLFEHRLEGPDDMAAHVRTVLTQVDLSLPVRGGECGLGTWQGIYVFEHRFQPQRRRVIVTVQG
jgi:secondary thiamine-phosphate synthase enzyme